jgi:hypothetical protein
MRRGTRGYPHGDPQMWNSLKVCPLRRWCVNKNPEIHLAKRFLRSEDSLGPQLQLLMTGEVHDFVRRYRADPKTAVRGFDRVATSLPSGIRGQLLELEVSGKDRLVAHWQPPRLTLLDVGGHTTVQEYEARWVTADLASATQAPTGYWPDTKAILGFFGNATSTVWDRYPNEDDAEWLYRLGASQTAVVNRIRKKLDRSSLLNQERVFVVGGPGTGKTSVLLVLLLTLTREGLRAGIHLSDKLADLVTASGFNVQPYRVRGSLPSKPLDVFLYDDPNGTFEIRSAMNEAFGHSRLVAVAFDPCQMEADLTDDVYLKTKDAYGVDEQRLRDCYRQKSTVGSAAKRVMDRVAESSPFLSDNKIEAFKAMHEHVYAISNDLRFVNRGGLERVETGAKAEHIKKAIASVRKRPRWGLPAPNVLVVVDEQTATTNWPWKRWLDGIDYVRIALPEIEQVKGLEFQWVFIVIRQSLFDEIESGFVGSSQRVYNARRLLRLPFTRARDGMFTFVMPDQPNGRRFDPYTV